jgi:alanyl-tRNA synthetase
MTSAKIRQQFIDFFKEKKHTFAPSAPVIPPDDPTLLFNNAGMNQFKDVFLNTGKRPYSRAVNSQKCIRVSGKHNDLEEVGHDTYHHTFFEMLGNWSFGDYYKKEAIEWAWELFTSVWKLPKDKLYVTVFETDDEAAELWASQTDVNKAHIQRHGEKDNFWEMGTTGPCGPCSEIHIDLGAERCDKPHIAHECKVNGECGRYIELWNLVFIQYNRDENGTLTPLPQKHVDTGAGFERIVSVLQNVNSNYATDVFTPILKSISDVVGQDYSSSKNKSAFHVIADHIRMLTFSIADGGLPSNEGRGYVMRRILRRAARYGRLFHMKEAFIYKLVDVVTDTMGHAFPEIIERKDHIKTVILSEEEQFNRTLDRGLEIFSNIKQKLQQEQKTIIDGKNIFKLYDTYGFPVDLTRVLASENNFSLDMEGFDKEMEAQRTRARSSAKFEAQHIKDEDWTILNAGAHSQFLGYENLSIETKIARYYNHENMLQVILIETPFYAESGGQWGDKGILKIDDTELEVIDTQKDGDLFIHICKPNIEFQPAQNSNVLAKVTSSIRHNTAKNHTATHLLHAALREVLGEHVTQAGSLVEADRLRFDFSHFEKINDQQLQKIEMMVNHKIGQNIPLKIASEKFDKAKEKGAMALFGEKYGDIVRTVSISDFSFELCGGTHVQYTGEIGPFFIIAESGIASGVRRIEAVSGFKAVEKMLNAKNALYEASTMLNCKEAEITQKIAGLLTQKKEQEKEIKKLSSQSLLSNIDSLISEAKDINGVNVLIHQTEDAEMNLLKELGDKIRNKVNNLTGLIVNKAGEKVNFVVFVTDDLLKDKKYNAGNIVREVAKSAGGGGGGRPHLATAGAKDPNKINEALSKFKELMK